jgi:uncharacterized protein (DUF488 family)
MVGEGEREETVHRIIVYTIGHSNLEIEIFVAHLQAHGIACLVDVRTHPRSQRYPQFNGPDLAERLDKVEIRYRHERDLGGKPADLALRTSDGRPDYDRMEASVAYQVGIDALCVLAASTRVAIMCGEGDYRHCHREKLIGRTLRARGVQVLHILPDGSLTEEPQGTLLEGRPVYSSTGETVCEAA